MTDSRNIRKNHGKPSATVTAGLDDGRLRKRKVPVKPRESKAEAAVGYKKPPRQHRWVKGQSGNPSGRQKGSKNRQTTMISLMEEKLGRKIEDISKLSRYEAMLLKGIQKALAGDIKAMAFILRRYDDAAGDQIAKEQVASEQDEKVYAGLVEKIEQEVQEDK